MKRVMLMDIKVLIVEDDPMVAEINKKFTEAVKGFLVVGQARNGMEAMAQIPVKQPDLVILDIYMPQCDGMEVLQEIRKQDRPVDIIMITAADDTVTVSKALRQGVVAYITKPFKFERYKAVLEGYRHFKQTIMQKENLGQEEIDGLLPVRMTREERDMPKNIQAQTLQRISQYLLEQAQSFSAEEVAAGVGMSRVTSRRYLEYMAEQGLAERELYYIAVGRPIHRFRLVRQPEK
ncbi:response regulator [Lucifera butyrica]|nr:response regulator [Lucifera butyrica]